VVPESVHWEPTRGALPVSKSRPQPFPGRLTPSTIRAYAARGQMPTADRRIGREPVWRPATIRKWHSQRPRLARSDSEAVG